MHILFASPWPAFRLPCGACFPSSELCQALSTPKLCAYIVRKSLGCLRFAYLVALVFRAPSCAKHAKADGLCCEVLRFFSYHGCGLSCEGRRQHLKLSLHYHAIAAGLPLREGSNLLQPLRRAGPLQMGNGRAVTWCCPRGAAAGQTDCQSPRLPPWQRRAFVAARPAFVEVRRLVGQS